MFTFPKAFLESWPEVFDICPRSGFLIPCMSLMWFFSITLVVNEVLLSVQNLKIFKQRTGITAAPPLGPGHPSASR